MGYIISVGIKIVCACVTSILFHCLQLARSIEMAPREFDVHSRRKEKEAEANSREEKRRGGERRGEKRKEEKTERKGKERKGREGEEEEEEKVKDEEKEQKEGETKTLL